MNNIAVVLIDMQPTFTKKLAPAVLENLVQNQSRLVSDCARLDVPLILLETLSFKRTISPILSEVERVADVMTIIKPFDNGFEDTRLGFILKNQKIDKLVLTGINASFCVRRTAVGAINREMEVFTSDELIADCDCQKCRPKKKSRDWYEANTKFFEQPTSLEEFLSAASRVRKKQPA